MLRRELRIEKPMTFLKAFGRESHQDLRGSGAALAILKRSLLVELLRQMNEGGGRLKEKANTCNPSQDNTV